MDVLSLIDWEDPEVVMQQGNGGEAKRKKTKAESVAAFVRAGNAGGSFNTGSGQSRDVRPLSRRMRIDQRAQTARRGTPSSFKEFSGRATKVTRQAAANAKRKATIAAKKKSKQRSTNRLLNSLAV